MTSAKKTKTKAKTTTKKTIKSKPAKKPAAKKAASKPKTAIRKAAPIAKPAVTAKAIMPKVESPKIESRVYQKPTIQKPIMQKPMMQKPIMGGISQKPAMPIIDTKTMVVAENDNIDFTTGDYVVYPAHGVGLIEGVETQTIGGMQISLYAISFEKDRMRLKIPVVKARSSGLRKLSTSRRIKDAIETLQGRARVRRTMWSRRAQEYETKINSGDPVSIAEVLRDLKRSNDDTEQSYSERQIYQSALERLAREFAAIKNIPEMKATEHLEDILGTNKGIKTASAA